MTKRVEGLDLAKLILHSEVLFIKNFDTNHIKVSPRVVKEMERLSSKCLPLVPKPNVVTVSAKDYICIDHLNVHS